MPKRPETPNEREARHASQFWFVMASVWGAGLLGLLKMASRKLFGWP